MDGLKIAFAIIKPYLWLVPIIILFSFFNTALFKGWFGEIIVHLFSKKKLPPETYRPFKNVTIPTSDGTTQIDQIYVSPYGIFVVEVKNYKGWIFGHESDAQWTQTFYKKKYRFQNPLRQNYKHIKGLENLLDLPTSMFHSVVVFVGDGELKTQLPPNVCTLATFDNYILSFQTRLLSDLQVEELSYKIERGRLVPNRATHRAHVEQLRNKKR